MKKNIFSFCLLMVLVSLLSAAIVSCKENEDPGTGPTPEETQLTITSIEPLTARQGDTIKIVGTGFSTNVIENEVRFNQNAAAAVISATATELKVKVPANGGIDGKINVIVGEKSAVSTQSFTLDVSLSAPVIETLDPEHGLAGSNTSITGKNFKEDGAVTKVFFGTTEAEILSSEDPTPSTTKLTVKIPASLAEGEVEVRVERDGQLSNIAKFTVDAVPKTVKATYFSNGSAIFKGTVTETGVDVEVVYDSEHGGVTSVNGLALNPIDNKIYFVGNAASSEQGLIFRAPADGSGPVEELYTYTDDLKRFFPYYDIALDVVNGTLYFAATDRSRDVIFKANYKDLDADLEMMYASDEFSGNYIGVKVDPATNKIYWAESITRRIMEGSLDGTQAPKVLFDNSDGIGGPYNIAIDTDKKKIFVLDYPEFGNGDKAIYSGNLDGSGSLTWIVPEGENFQGGFDIEVDVENDLVIWFMQTSGAPSEQRVVRCKYDGSDVQLLFSTDENSGAGFFDLDIR